MALSIQLQKYKEVFIHLKCLIFLPIIMEIILPVYYSPRVPKSAIGTVWFTYSTFILCFYKSRLTRKRPLRNITKSDLSTSCRWISNRNGLLDFSLQLSSYQGMFCIFLLRWFLNIGVVWLHFHISCSWDLSVHSSFDIHLFFLQDFGCYYGLNM